MGSVEVNAVVELLQESSQWFPGGSKQMKVLIVHSIMRVGRKVLPRLLLVFFFPRKINHHKLYYFPNAQGRILPLYI